MPTHKVYSKYAGLGNDVLQCRNLSLKAKGLLGYLVSKPEGWSFSAKRIAKEIKEGYEAILSGMKELETVGLLVREKVANGRVLYHVYSSYELLNSPESDNATVGKPHSGKTRLINNKEYRIKKKKNKFIATEDVYKSLISFWNDRFGNRYSTSLSNETQKNNFEKWLKQYSYDEIRAAILLHKFDEFWNDKMDPTILFRQKNKNQDPVDYIGKLLSQKYSHPEAKDIKDALVRMENAK